MDEIKSLAIWGDSILKGIVFDEQLQKYKGCDRCAADILAESFPEINIKNNSRFGNIITKGRKLIERALAAGNKTDAAIIEFGGNDCDFNWQEVSAEYLREHDPHTPFDIFVDQLREIVTLMRENGIQPIIMNLPPISADRYFDWFCRDEGTEGDRVLHWLCEKQIIYRTQERYSHAADMVAKELDVPLLDIRTEFLGIRDYGNYLCADGIHLNEKGQQILGETLSEKLGRMLRADTKPTA